MLFPPGGGVNFLENEEQIKIYDPNVYKGVNFEYKVQFLGSTWRVKIVTRIFSGDQSGIEVQDFDEI